MRSTAFTLAFALLLASTATAQTSSCAPRLVGMDRRGPASAIARSGDTLFLGNGAALTVIDTSDLLAPVELGFVNLDRVAVDVASWGAVAVVLGEGGLVFVDASDPAHPVVASTLDFPAGWTVASVAARDDRAYYPGPDGLHIVDFTDPADPVEVGFFAAAEARDVVLRGDRAYLLAGPAILVLDVSNPAAPTQLAAVPASGLDNERLTIALGGGWISATGTGCAHVHCWAFSAFYDLADPDLPLQRGTIYEDEESVDAVALAGERAYLADRVYDISDLSNPVFLGRRPGPWASALFGAADPDYLFVAAPEQGLLVEEVSDPPAAQVVATVRTPGPASDGYLAGSTAVVVYHDGLRTFDLTDRAHPEPLGSLLIPDERFSEVVRVDDHAYVTGDSYPDASLWLFDLADPALPRVAGSLGSYVIAPPVRAGNSLYVADECNRFVAIYDVSDPGSPQPAGSVPIDDLCHKTDFTAAAGRLYLWHYDHAPAPSLLRTFDVSDPAQPSELGATQMDPWHWGRSAARNGFLLLTDEDRFDVVDVRDPAAAVRVATLPMPLANWYRRRLSIYGSLALVAPDESDWEDYDDRLHLVDVADALQPTPIGTIETPGDARGAFAGPGLIVVADGPAGISVYESCVPFADGFESGDASAWSAAAP
jgi:hypothetical protein